MVRIDDLEARVGERRTSVEDLRVEAGKVAEFAAAIGDDNPAYREEAAAREQGFRAIPAPPTFTRVSAFPRYRPGGVGRLGFDLDFDVRREIHGEQAYGFERPVYVGDVLEGTTGLTDVFQREGSRGGTMTFAVLETEYRDAGGDLVVTERSTIIETESAIENEGSAPEGEETVDPRIEGATVAQTTTGYDERTYLEDVEEGEAGLELTVEGVTRADFVRYAGASGDFNPIHYDEPYARSLDNPGVFGQGMLTAGYASHLAADWFGLASIRRFEARFLDRLWPGDALTFTGAVTDVDADAGTVDAEIVGERASGEALIESRVTAEPPSRSGE